MKFHVLVIALISQLNGDKSKCLAFLPGAHRAGIRTTSGIALRPPTHTFRNTYQTSNGLRMTEDNDEEDDDDDDDDEYLDDSALGDWRSFRKTLVETGLSADSSAAEGYIEDKVDDGNNEEDNDNSIGEKSNSMTKSVSKANEELLMTQNEGLAKEYMEGVWAHALPVAEAGGLVVRLPLEAEIYRNKDKLTIGKELTRRMETDEGNSNTASFLTGGNDEGEKSKNPNLSFSPSSAQTLLWYKKAQSLINEQIGIIASYADENGAIDPRQLDPKAEKLLQMYLDNQGTWQEVCLVASKDEEDNSATTLVLNRPMAFSLSENLAKLILYGAYIGDRKITISEQNLYSKFLRAFESSCAVYVGGPDKVENPATIIHGIADLEGAEEISPGTGIYKGGLPAAVKGVLHGKYKPLDFRFFVGCHDYANGELDAVTYASKYQAIACARPLALKQCIQLPKPLWHEVMELAGGELKEISMLELMKRNDIQQD